MKTLVVQSAPSPIPPLGLMKIATWRKSLGDSVSYTKEYGIEVDYDPDLIMISSPIFSWQVNNSINVINYYKQRFPLAEIRIGGVMASRNPAYYLTKTGLPVYEGILWEAENYKPDYEMFGWLNSSLVFTSRGCHIGCGFCIVPTIEGLRETINEEWKSHIDTTRKDLIVQDNNILAAPWHHFIDVTSFIKEHKFKVDFNSGFEPHSAREKHFEEMKGINFSIIRTAFDEIGEEREFEKIMELTRHYITDNYRKITVYVLYNYKDTPEDALYRCNRVIELGGSPYVMPYFPLDWYNSEYYISENWTREQIIAFRRFWDLRSCWQNAMKQTRTITFNTIKNTLEGLNN